jgi:hypothetical protein
MEVGSTLMTSPISCIRCLAELSYFSSLPTLEDPAILGPICSICEVLSSGSATVLAETFGRTCTEGGIINRCRLERSPVCSP